jgi:ParB-like chromosome segregation protein Spo0J
MKMLKRDKKDLTVREHLKMIQSDGGKARWAKLTPEERSAQARKIVGARWAKKRAAAEAVPGTSSSAEPPKGAAKKSPKYK